MYSNRSGLFAKEFKENNSFWEGKLQSVITPPSMVLICTNDIASTITWCAIRDIANSLFSLYINIGLIKDESEREIIRLNTEIQRDMLKFMRVIISIERRDFMN
jgi:hypothetical protein